jgi:uncharacterized protein (DUF305 family)
MALVLTAGCSGPGATPPTPAPATSAVISHFGGTDLAWIEINIAMNEELSPLLALVPSHSTNTRVKELAATVGAYNEQELGRLRDLHQQAQLPAENPHEGMPMPGMLTPDLVAAAAATRGPAFDKLFLGHLTAHLEQGMKLAQSEEKAGKHPDTLALAKSGYAERATLLPKAKSA